MTAYLNATHYGWVEKKIFNSRCSKTAILAFLKPFGKPFKDGNFRHLDVISTPATYFQDSNLPLVSSL